MTAVDLDSLEVKKMRTLPYGETFQSVRCVNWFARFYSKGPNLFLSFFSHKAPVRRVVFPRHLFLSLKAKLTTICDNKIKSEKKKKKTFISAACPRAPLWTLKLFLRLHHCVIIFNIRNLILRFIGKIFRRVQTWKRGENFPPLDDLDRHFGEVALIKQPPNSATAKDVYHVDLSSLWLCWFFLVFLQKKKVFGKEKAVFTCFFLNIHDNYRELCILLHNISAKYFTKTWDCDR